MSRCRSSAIRTAGSAGQRWLPIVAPMQPGSLDAHGYPGWVLAEHLGDKVPDSPERASATAPSGDAAHAQAFLAVARAHLGIPTCGAGCATRRWTAQVWST